MAGIISALAALIMATVALLTYLDKKDNNNSNSSGQQSGSPLEKKPTNAGSSLQKN